MEKEVQAAINIKQTENNLYSQRPDLMHEWDWENNNRIGLNPTEVVIGSNKRAYWICSRCGHRWDAVINKRAVLNQGCGVCAGRKVIEGHNDFMSCNPGLMQEWDWENNDKNNIYPNLLTSRSNVKAHWICKNGHKWVTAIATRVGSKNRKGTNCPYCGNESTSYPEQFLFNIIKLTYKDTLNGGKTRNNVQYDIVIPCEKVAIEYNGSFYHSRRDNEESIRQTKIELCRLNKVKYIEIVDIDSTNGSPRHLNGVIYYNHLTYKEEEQLVEVVKLLNSILNINVDISLENIMKARLEAIRATRNKVIANSLARCNKALALEFDVEKNGITPDKVSAGSSKRYFWKCAKCKHEWITTVSSRALNGARCPACTGRVSTKGKNDFATVHPKLALDWSAKNKLPPSAYTKCSGQRVYWKCHRCGYEWYGTISNRVSRNRKCPSCKHIEA